MTNKWYVTIYYLFLAVAGRMHLVQHDEGLNKNEDQQQSLAGSLEDVGHPGGGGNPSQGKITHTHISIHTLQTI